MPDPTVFMVDDDNVHCDSVRELLLAYGLPIETFSSVEAFLGAFDPTRAGCILLEARLASTRSGRSSLAALGLPIVLVSDHDQRSSVPRWLHARALAFVQKPYRALELLEAIWAAFRVAPDPI